MKIIEQKFKIEIKKYYKIGIQEERLEIDNSVMH